MSAVHAEMTDAMVKAHALLNRLLAVTERLDRALWIAVCNSIGVTSRPVLLASTGVVYTRPACKTEFFGTFECSSHKV